jgi:hypothetical protein
MGGYLAGRLRTKWVDAQTDEVFFRDTAHGFLAWAVASLATAALLGSVVGSIVGSGVQAGASVAGAASTAAAGMAGGAAAAGADSTAPGNDGSLDYFVDSLFRADRAAPAAPAGPDAAAPAGAEQTAEPDVAEVARIVANGVRLGALPAEDVTYLGQVIAEQTDLTQQQAEQRVTETFARVQAALQEAETAVRQAADEAREASAYASLWLFISLLAGAFIASLAATYGGRQRDL